MIVLAVAIGALLLSLLAVWDQRRQARRYQERMNDIVWRAEHPEPSRPTPPLYDWGHRRR